MWKGKYYEQPIADKHEKGFKMTSDCITKGLILGMRGSIGNINTRKRTTIKKRVWKGKFI